MVTYLQKRLDICPRTFNTISWGAIGTVRASYGIAWRVRTSKMIYRWLTVGHNWQKCNLKSDKCPCCGQPDETFEHLLKCSNKKLQQVRKNGYLEIQRDYDSEKLPANFTRTFLQALRLASTAKSPTPISNKTLQITLDAQAHVGFYNMAVGFLATEWTKTLETWGVEHPQSTTTLLLAMIWDHLCEPLWTTRNNILHSTNNHV